MPNYPLPQPHDPIEELFEDVFWVHGSMRMGPGLGINRNMVVLRQADELTVVNSVRLSAEGEAALEALGRVKHVVRLGQFHGLDDPYYVDRYGAEFWCQAGSDRYPDPKPTQVLTEGTALPVDAAELFVFRGTVRPECAILLRRHGGVLITCDCVQHWTDWSYCSPLARPVWSESLLGRDCGPPAVRRARAGADPRVRCRERQNARVGPIKSEPL
jgi:hypothetical protein